MPWQEGRPIAPEDFRRLSQRMIFECCKWDPQIGDQSALSPCALVLDAGHWRRLARWAQEMSAELLSAEQELLDRPELHRTLGLPWRIRRALADARHAPSVGMARLMRFDFHFAAEGWQVSEVNADVPGGFPEAGGFSVAMAEFHPRAGVPGDPSASLAQAIHQQAEPGVIAMVHATAYSDDRQVMEYLGRYLQALGRQVAMAAPDHLRWSEGRAKLNLGGDRRRIGGIVRFFPAEWSASLGKGCGWRNWFGGGLTPQCNPGSALLIQSKRLGLVLDDLRTPMPVWRRLVPPIIEPRQLPRAQEDEWVMKPAWGRVGEAVGINGVTTNTRLKAILAHARRHSRHWVAQRRFNALPWKTQLGSMYPCIGVYCVAGKAVGAYARASAKPLIDFSAQDVAVLISDTVPSGLSARPPVLRVMK